MPAIAAALRRVLAARMDRVNILVRANFRRFAALLSELDIAASALSIAIAAAIGMGVQVENFRADFYKMLDQRLWPALYIESERQVDSQWLRRLPGVTDVRSYGRTEALLNGRPIAVTLSVGDALESRRYGYDGALEEHVMLSESGALAYDLAVGDSIEIEGPRGARRVGIAHVFSDYGAPSPRVVGTYKNLAPIFDGIVKDRTSVLTVGSDTGALKRAIAQTLSQCARARPGGSARGWRRRPSTGHSKWPKKLTIIALFVAVAGLYNALSALVLRARDIHRLLYAAGVFPVVDCRSRSAAESVDRGRGGGGRSAPGSRDRLRAMRRGQSARVRLVDFVRRRCIGTGNADVAWHRRRIAGGDGTDLAWRQGARGRAGTCAPVTQSSC